MWRIATAKIIKGVWNASYKNDVMWLIDRITTPQQKQNIGSTKGSAPNKLVITIAPQKLIWPHGNT